MQCQKCKSDRILEICIKDHGDFSAYFKGEAIESPSGLDGIYSGGYTDPKICFECGQVQGTFPIADPKIAANVEVTPSHTDAALMLNDIMTANYQSVFSADDPGSFFMGFSCCNVNDKGEDKSACYYTIHYSKITRFLKVFPKMEQFFSTARGRVRLTEKLKSNRNFYEWYAKLQDSY